MDRKTRDRGVKLLRAHLEKFLDEIPELGDLHDAFEYFAMQKYGLGDVAESRKVGGSGDCGVDFYSSHGPVYHVGQTKIPAPNWREAHPDKVRKMGLLKHASGQFVEEKRHQLGGVSRLRTLLLRPGMRVALKEKTIELDGRRNLDKEWKPQGVTFQESLPDLVVTD